MTLPVTLITFVLVVLSATAVMALTEQEILDGAAERIERFRKADATIRVVTANGQPVSHAQVHVEQVGHAFLFGCNAFPVLNLSDPQQEATYEREFTALLNYATLGFYWGGYEPTPGQTRAAQLEAQARWCKRRGIATKGHPLVWHLVYPQWAPSDPDETRQALKARVTDIVSRFAGLIDRWDVVNEATTSAEHDNGVGHWAKRDGALSLVSEALSWARAANPKATLLYNDFKIGADFEALTKALADSKQPFDVLGIQSHMHRGDWPIEKVWTICETYSRFGKPLHFTEMTALSGAHGWELPKPWASTPEGEEHQAEYVGKLYTVLFSHPAVEAITWWDFMDGGWMGAPAGLVRADLSPKPVYDRLLSLVKGDWWTRADLRTADDGSASFRGFLGRYRVTVTTPSGAKTKLMELRRSRRSPVTVKLD